MAIPTPLFDTHSSIVNNPLILVFESLTSPSKNLSTNAKMYGTCQLMGWREDRHQPAITPCHPATYPNPATHSSSMLPGIDLGIGVGSGNVFDVEASGLDISWTFFGVPFVDRFEGWDADDGCDLILKDLGLSLREIFFLSSFGVSGGVLRMEESRDGGGSDSSEAAEVATTSSVGGGSVMVDERRWSRRISN